MAADELDWDDLRYFLAAARAETLAGAARALGVEHTTVGRRLSALERSLAVALVLRGSDGLRLTELGEQLRTHVEELERGVLAIRALSASAATRVRLAVPSGFARYFTGELAQLCRDEPALLLEMSSGAQPVDLSRGEADLALRSGTIRDQELVVRKLCMAGFCVYAAESYFARHPGPARVDELVGHELIAFAENLSSAPPARWLEARAHGATVVLRSRELADMLTAAVSGVGLAVLPCSLGDAEPRLRRFAPDVVASTPLSLVYRREARLSKEVRTVIRFVTDVVKRNASLIHGVRA